MTQTQPALIDSHCHLSAERFADDRDAVVERARAAGIRAMVTVGTGVADGHAALALAERFDDVFAAAGVHPHEAGAAAPDALQQLEPLLQHPRMVAVGETGLDYYYEHAPREAQRASFEAHLELGRRLDLPVIVHTRDADDDTEAVLRAAGQGTRGVLHCFTGGRRLMEAALELGWHVSFSGIITFSSYADADLLRDVPRERLMVETDSPYLAPVPHRGGRNEPAFVAAVARRAAELRGEDPAELAAATLRNTVEFYRLPL